MIRIYTHGKFDTSTRRGKATVQGNTVHVTVDNFIKYANAKGFFCYKHDEQVQENNSNNVITSTYTRYVNVNTSLNVRKGPGVNYGIVRNLKNGQLVTVYETNGIWSRVGTNEWICNTYLTETNIQVQSTIGSIKKLTRSSILYSNSNLSGTKYNYKANTSITILENINSCIDKVRVNMTGRIAYIDNSNYSNIVISKSKSTTRKTKSCILYSKSNLSGTKYQYKDNTTITVLQHVNSYIDKVKVNATNRVAYINVNNYK